MIEKTLKFVLGLFAGAVCGAAVAVLLTPKSGEDSRGEIRNSFDEIRLDYELGKEKKRQDLEADLRRRWGE